MNEDVAKEIEDLELVFSFYQNFWIKLKHLFVARNNILNNWFYQGSY